MKIAVCAMLSLLIAGCSPNKQRFQLFNTVNVNEVSKSGDLVSPKTLMIDTQTGKLWEVNYFPVGHIIHDELLARPIETFKTETGYLEYQYGGKTEK